MTNIRYGRKYVMKRGCGSLLRSSTAAGLRSGGTGQPYIGKNYPKPIYWHISDYQQIIDIKKWNFLIIKMVIYMESQTNFNIFYFEMWGGEPFLALWPKGFCLLNINTLCHFENNYGNWYETSKNYRQFEGIIDIPIVTRKKIEKLSISEKWLIVYPY